MSDRERDLKIASLMVSDLKAYLLSDQLYWSLGEVGPIHYPFPKGTLGGLFLRLRRLESSQEHLTSSQRQHLAALQATMDQQFKDWAVQFGSKSMREIEARLQNWSAYLEDLADAPHRYWSEYPTQVEGRVIIELLLDLAGRAANEKDIRARLDGLDLRLRGMVTEGTFVWDVLLAPVFPQDSFWWLYVSPRS